MINTCINVTRIQGYGADLHEKLKDLVREHDPLEIVSVAPSIIENTHTNLAHVIEWVVIWKGLSNG